MLSFPCCQVWYIHYLDLCCLHFGCEGTLTFMSYRRLMDTTMVELATHPNDKLLTKFLDALGARQVERMFKPAAFSLETTPSPSLGPASRRRRLNMNVSPDETHQQPNRNGAGNRSHPYDQRQSNGGATRGHYNKNFRPPQRSFPRFSPSPSATQ
jgi:hypothetical protein